MKKDNKKKKREKGKGGKSGRFARFVSYLKSNRIILLKSFVWAVVLFVGSYFLHNLPWSWGGKNVGQWIELITHGTDGTVVPSDIYLINVAYDRELVDLAQDGDTIGNIDITDRSKLLSLLERLRDADYKYIMLDVVFDDRCHTEVDSALFNLIASMDNIVIAKSKTSQLANEILMDKARYSNYSQHILESDFVKYEYIQNGEPTLPYQMYLDLGGKKMSNWCGMYFFNGRLATKSVILRHPIRLLNESAEDQQVELNGAVSEKVQLNNLGSRVLKYRDNHLMRIVKDKIVVIGDFTENDIHDTYLGKMAGPIINLNAYYALVNDNLSMPYSEIIFIILLYTVIWFCIFKRISLISLLTSLMKGRARLMAFIVSFVYFTLLLLGVSGVIYLIFGLDMSILIASMVVTVAVLLSMAIWCYIKKIPLISLLTCLSKSRLMSFIASFVNYTLLLAVVSGLMYVIWGLDMRIFVAASVFTLVDNIKK